MSKHAESGEKLNQDLDIQLSVVQKDDKPPQFSDIISKKYEPKETKLKKSVIPQARRLSI